MEDRHEKDIGSSGDGRGRWRGRDDGSGACPSARLRPGPGIRSGGWRTDRGRDRGDPSVLRLWLRPGLLLWSARLLRAWPVRLLWRAVLPSLLSSLVTTATVTM